MGRPASLERHSRGPWYRGAQGSPTKVTAPGSALTIKIREASCDPREMFRHSAHSFQAINKRDKEQTRQDHYIIPYNIATKGRQTRWHKPRHGHAQSGLPGAATRTRADTGPQGKKEKRMQIKKSGDLKSQSKLGREIHVTRHDCPQKSQRRW